MHMPSFKIYTGWQRTVSTVLDQQIFKARVSVLFANNHQEVQCDMKRTHSNHNIGKLVCKPPLYLLGLHTNSKIKCYYSVYLPDPWYRLMA